MTTSLICGGPLDGEQIEVSGMCFEALDFDEATSSFTTVMYYRTRPGLYVLQRRPIRPDVTPTLRLRLKRWLNARPRWM